MSKADIEHIKSQLSKQIDGPCRMAYGRLPVERPRQFVFTGTTNETSYLKDTTGNRRIWPIKVERFKVSEIKRDRDQLWAEAAAREAKGESIRLDPKLWDAAADEQRERLADDPFYDSLSYALGDLTGKITLETIWDHLGFQDKSKRTSALKKRIEESLALLGWRKPKNRTITIKQKKPTGYVKGEPPFEVIVIRSGGAEVTEQDSAPEVTEDDLAM